VALIMVADDDESVASLLQDLLRSLGHQVVRVADGVAMVEKAKTWRPHLIIADITMPGAYGTAAYKCLRDEPAAAEIPVLFLTGVSPAAAAKLVPSGPRTRLLHKPVDISALTAAIDGLLNGPKSPS
jgi:CheY-like chemotaxis protein